MHHEGRPGEQPSRFRAPAPETDKTADWPALSTVGKPVAGPGVNKHLLGMVYRKDIGADQVTYNGKLLYMFDPAPGQYGGVNFMETVAPLPPWHGLWYLVSAKNGLPATGPVAISTQKQTDGSTVLTAAMFQGMAGPTGLPIVVYSYSKDSKNHSNCTGACALELAARAHHGGGPSGRRRVEELTRGDPPLGRHRTTHLRRQAAVLLLR